MHHHVDEFANLIVKCKTAKDLAKGLYLHCSLCEYGLDVHSTLGNDVVSMLVEARGMVHAQQVFNKLSCQSGCSRSSLIAGFVKQGEPHRAIALYQMTTKYDILASNDAVVALLKACAIIKDPETGTRIHIEALRKGLLETNVYVCNTLIHMYAQCGLFTRAEEVIVKLPSQKVVYWNSLIGGLVEHGRGEEALDALEQMQHEGLSPNAVTLVCGLKVCASIGDLPKGCEIHSELAFKGYLESNMFVASTLVDMYAKCGSIDHAEEAFKKLQVQNVVSWNALMTGYVSKNLGQEAIEAFRKMQHEGVPPDAVTLACLPKACISAGLIDKSQEAHIEIVLRGLERESLVGVSLINMYAKFGFLLEAQEVFDKLQSRSLVSWTALIAGYVSYGYDDMALYCYDRMCGEALSPDSLTFASCLKACASMEATGKGQELHVEVFGRGLLDNDVFIGSALVDMYAKGGCLEEARSVFDSLPIKDVAVWNAYIAGYAECECAREALEHFESMQCEGIFPDATTFMCSLKACASIGETNKGRQIHAEIVKEGLSDLKLFNTLVGFYAKCGLFSDALRLLDDSLFCDPILWNALISGYIERGSHEQALLVLDKIQRRGAPLGNITLLLGLKACGSMGAISMGKDLHAYIVLIGAESELSIGNTLVDVYFKSNLLVEAQEIFNKLQIQTIVSWNSLISGYADRGHGDVALICFEHLNNDGLSPDAVTLASCLKACGSIGATNEGLQLHLFAAKKGLERELLVGNTLIDMYATCGLLEEAKDVLQKLPVQAVASWTALILGYAKHGHLEESLCVFRQMRLSGLSPDAITLFCCSTFCGSVGATIEGREIHAEIVKRGYLESGNFSGSNLVDMYVKWGFFAEAQQVLNTSPGQDAIASNVLMTGYVKHKYDEHALHCFGQMRQNHVPFDSLSLVCGLVACGNLGTMAKAREVHVEAVKRGLEKEPLVGNTLLDMYAKCGSLANAGAVFNKLSMQDLVSWNVLILCYGQLGESARAFTLFDRMEQEGMKPDTITFVNILNICSHGGLVYKGKKCFKAIDENYGIIPTREHLNCLVDLLGRAGQVEKAFIVIEWMPYHPDALVWHTMLGACRKWNDVELGRNAFKQAVCLDVGNASAYTSIFNIFADAAIHEQERDSEFMHLM